MKETANKVEEETMKQIGLIEEATALCKSAREKLEEAYVIESALYKISDALPQEMDIDEFRSHFSPEFLALLDNGKLDEVGATMLDELYDLDEVAHRGAPR
jgi:hypothetical protein